MNPPLPHVSQLYLKAESGAPRLPADQLRLIRGYGIEGDIHAHAMNPRQLLVTRSEDLESFGLLAGQLLENIIISDSAEADFVPGARLRLGSGAEIRLTMHCEPCQRIAAYVSQKAIYGKRGLLGVVTASGTISIGEPLLLEPQAFAALPEKPYLRFLQILEQVPAGRVLSYRALLLAMGVLSSYARAIPRYIAQARTDSADWPLHRLLDSRGLLIEQHLPGQGQLLRAEGVELIEAEGMMRVELEHFELRNQPLFLE